MPQLSDPYLRAGGAALLAVVLVLAWVASGSAQEEWETLEVSASAYTIAEDETKKGNVGLAAWGDQLEPGMRAIAVSRDLIAEGLTHEAEVKIEGLPGVYVVRDKMNKRWEEKIDVLMPEKSAAKEWGKKEVTIQWRPAPVDSE